MKISKKRSTDQKIQIFADLFQGLRSAYGTYSLETGKYWQVKTQVKKNTIYNHLKGIQPYGFYPLIGKNTRVGVVDFDHLDPEPPIQFIYQAEHHGLTAYLERSKSKGFHVWMFFPKVGVPADKVRIVMRFLLQEIEHTGVEIFPKQDKMYSNNTFGNFINAPLFGQLVAECRTVFIRPESNLKPYRDQWEMLESVQRIPEQQLDSVIDINGLEQTLKKKVDLKKQAGNSRYSLPLCIQRILEEGVTFDQRVACFRIAVHFKRIGLPYELAVAALSEWSKRNKPIEYKRIITENEIEEQVMWAYKKDYTGYGCQEPVIRAFCDPSCQVRYKR